VPRRELTPEDAGRFQHAFEQKYAQMYGKGSLFAGVGLEYDVCRVTGTHAVEPVGFAEHELADASSEAAVKSERSAWFEQGGFVTTPVYDGTLLQAGNRVEGPAVVERMGDSVVVPPGYTATVDPFLTLVLTGNATPPEAMLGEAAEARS
jgi:N-methylhydantoinase A